MTTVADWHTRALAATGRIVASIPADRWRARTPCPEWEVRGLVSHLVSGNWWAAELGCPPVARHQVADQPPNFPLGTGGACPPAIRRNARDNAAGGRQCPRVPVGDSRHDQPPEGGPREPGSAGPPAGHESA